QPFDIPIHAEKGVVCSEHGSTRGQQRQTYQARTAEHEFSLAVRCNSRDAASPIQGSGHVEPAFAVKSQALRSAQPPVEKTHFALIIDAADAVITRRSRPGDVELADRAESQ